MQAVKAKTTNIVHEKLATEMKNAAQQQAEQRWQGFVADLQELVKTKFNRATTEQCAAITPAGLESAPDVVVEHMAQRIIERMLPNYDQAKDC